MLRGLFIIGPVGPVIFRPIQATIERQIRQSGNGSETEALVRSPDQRLALSGPGQLPYFITPRKMNFAAQGAGFEEFHFFDRPGRAEASPSLITFGHTGYRFEPHRFGSVNI